MSSVPGKGERNRLVGAPGVHGLAPHSPLAECSPVFSPWAGCDKQVCFLPPLFPVSLSASCEENPAWFISLVAQILACMGLGERGETFASSRALQILHIKPTEKANLLPVQKSG